MKESVNIAFSWIKAHLNDLEIMGTLNQYLTTLEKAKYLD